MDKSLPLVTVSILTYNNFDYLNQAIQSVFSQDYPNIEIIISDDGSKNYDLAYVQRLIKDNPQNIKAIKIIHHLNNLGTVKNISNCLKNANGEYYIGLAADDVFYNEKVISLVVEYFLKSNALIVTSRRFLFDNTMENSIKILPTESDVKYLTEYTNFLYQRLCYANFISGACTFYSKKLFERYGYFDERYELLEDYPFYLMLSRNGCKIHYINEITIKYRLGGISTSGIVNMRLQNDSHKMIEFEILPYKEKMNKRIYNWRLFRYEREKSNRRWTLGLFTKHFFTILALALCKFRLLKLEEYLGLNKN